MALLGTPLESELAGRRHSSVLFVSALNVTAHDLRSIGTECRYEGSVGQCPASVSFVNFYGNYDR